MPTSDPNAELRSARRPDLQEESILEADLLLREHADRARLAVALPDRADGRVRDERRVVRDQSLPGAAQTIARPVDVLAAERQVRRELFARADVHADVAEIVDGVETVVLPRRRDLVAVVGIVGYQPKLFFGNSSKPSDCVRSAPNVTRFVNHDIGA